jgi:intracellular sulfur oxidation DsrE/DsrF family protein
MSSLIHKTDGGIMKLQKNGVKCQKCGYSLDQSEITSAYLNGKILLPFHSGPAKAFK